MTDLRRGRETYTTNVPQPDHQAGFTAGTNVSERPLPPSPGDGNLYTVICQIVNIEIT